MSEDQVRKKWETHPMLKPRIEKVVVNISVGKSGEPLEKAARVLKEITGQTPCNRRAKDTVRDFGIRQGESIACITTLRKEKAIEFLNKALPVVDKKISSRSFDRQGNFSFGLKEHIELPGVKYDPDVGIFGMDICVSVIRPGYRVKTRRKERSKIGTRHVLTPEDSKVFAKDALGVEITE
ncbi:MAG TPA: 50S ribosomal protein L5 [Candidatus Acidoferrales bacterium]|nr:50S ribosomal protein L5 [Candidatus Acidoferrales bacterium]